MKAYQKNQKSGPRRLPTIALHDGEYFVDRRLGEFRRVDNPHQRIDFDSPEGEAHRNTFEFIYCLDCGQELCMKLQTDGRPVCCPACGQMQDTR